MHDNYTILMSASLDGEATVEEQQLLQAHLQVCAACATTWDLWRRVDRLFASAPSATPALDYGDKVLSRLGQLPFHPDP